MDTGYKYTVALGNPFNGTTLHGIFDSFDDAEVYADKLFNKWETCIVRIEIDQDSTQVGRVSERLL